MGNQISLHYAGGVTTVIDMPNTVPHYVDPRQLPGKIAKVAGDSLVDFAGPTRSHDELCAATGELSFDNGVVASAKRTKRSRTS